MKLDYTFLVGGEAGQGLQTIGTVLSKALARQGLHVFANHDYYSRVRGGHNFFQIRAMAGEWGEKIPTGIFFAEKRQTLNQALLGKEPDFTLVEKDPQAKDIEPLLQEYL